MTLIFVGHDNWDRPVYENNGKFFVDVNPRKGWPAEICTKTNNELDGEPDSVAFIGAEIEFVPSRILWE